jgi:hypothetical protein
VAEVTVEESFGLLHRLVSAHALLRQGLGVPKSLALRPSFYPFLSTT